VMVVDDYNDRIVIINPHTKRIVWQYGHRAAPGTAQGYLHLPDGFDFVPVTAAGKPDPAAIVHGPADVPGVRRAPTPRAMPGRLPSTRP
jgi:hypothetical protein